MTVITDGRSATPIDPVRHDTTVTGSHHHHSGVSWAAIIAGAVASAALSLILLIVGTGLGLSAVSPWSDKGVSATSVGVSTIIWIIFMSFAASGIGGYMAGRLRTKWTGVHGDEVYFRDTAHGFLAWAVATLLTASLLSSAVSSIVGGAAKAGASVAGGVGSAALTAGAAGASAAGAEGAKSDDDNGASSLGYFTDSLFRKGTNPGATPGVPVANTSPTAPPADNAAASNEVAEILANAVATGNLPQDDLHYVAQVIAQRTGVTPEEAEKRVNDTYAKLKQKIDDAKVAAKDAADKARKASAYAALWIFIALLVGAFSASLFATFGGRRRDF